MEAATSRHETDHPSRRIRLVPWAPLASVARSLVGSGTISTTSLADRTHGAYQWVTSGRCGVGRWMIGQRCDLVDPVEGDTMRFTPIDRRS